MRARRCALGWLAAAQVSPMLSSPPDVSALPVAGARPRPAALLLSSALTAHRRFQSSRFTRSGRGGSVHNDANNGRGSSFPAGAGRQHDGRGESDGQGSLERLASFPLQDLTVTRPILTVAELQDLCLLVRQEMRHMKETDASAVPAALRQDLDNKQRHLLRQLYVFSFSILRPGEGEGFTVATLLQMLHALSCFPRESLPQHEEALANELAEWLERDIRAHLPLLLLQEEEGGTNNPTIGSTTGEGTVVSEASQRSAAAVLLHQYVTCAQALSTHLEAREMEDILLLLRLPIQQALEQSMEDGQGSSIATSDTTFDAYLSSVLAALAQSVRPNRADCVSSQGISIRGFAGWAELMPLAQELSQRLRARLSATNGKGFFHPELLTSILLALCELTGGTSAPASFPRDSVAQGASSNNSQSRGPPTGVLDVVSAERRRLEQIFTSAEWRQLVGSLVTRWTSPSTDSLSPLWPQEKKALLCAVLHFGGLWKAELAGVCDDVAKRLVKGMTSRAEPLPHVAAAHACSSLDLWEVLRLVNSHGNRNLTSFVVAQLGEEGKEEEEEVTHRAAVQQVIASLEKAGQETSVSEAVRQLKRLLLVGSSVSDAVYNADREAVAPAIHAMLNQLKENPILVNAISPQSVDTLLSATPVAKDQKLLRELWMKHLVEQYSRQNKVYVSQLACLFPHDALLPPSLLSSCNANTPSVSSILGPMMDAAVANLARWSGHEQASFLRLLSALSVALSKASERREQGPEQAARLARTHQGINDILRTCAGNVAAFVNPPSEEGSATGRGEATGDDFDTGATSAQEPPPQRRGNQARGHGPPSKPRGASASISVLSSWEVLELLQTFAACGVRNDAFTEAASERLAKLFRDASAAIARRPGSRGKLCDGAATGGKELSPVPVAAGESVASDLRAITSALSALAALDLRSNTAFLDAVPIITAEIGKTLVPENDCPSGRPLSPDVVVRLLAVYSLRRVWDCDIFACLAKAAKSLASLDATSGGFTLEQMTVVQQALVRMQWLDREMGELYLAAVESFLAEPQEPSLAHFQIHVGLLSAISRMSFSDYAKEQAHASLNVLVPDGDQDSGGIHVNGSLETYERFLYIPSQDPFQTRSRSVCSSLSDRIAAYLGSLRRRAEHGTDGDSASASQELDSDLVSELLISLARVFLFPHPLFGLLKKESLSAVLHVNSSLCLSHMVRAIALAAVVERQQQLQKGDGTLTATESDVGSDGPATVSAASSTSFYDEFFSLASGETVKMVQQQKLSAATLSHILFSVTIAGHHDDKLFVSVLPKMKLLAMYGTFSEIASVFYSYTKNNIWHQRLFAKLADRIIDCISRERVAQKEPLLLILESLASVGYRYDKLFDVVAVHVACMLEFFSFQDVCRLVHVYVSLRYNASPPPATDPDLLSSAPSSADSRQVAEGRSIYDVLYTTCGDRVVDLLRREKQLQRVDFLRRDQSLEASMRAFLTDLANAGAKHDALGKELEDVYPKLAKEFAHLQPS